MLYSTVAMESGKKNPYDTTKGGYRFIPHRISPEMSENLECIKHVIVMHHHPPSKLMGLSTTEYDIDSLRLRTRTFNRDQPCGRCKDKLDLGIRSCLFQMYRPKKLVVDGASIECGHQPVVDSARLETLVLRITINTIEYRGDWSPRSLSPRSSSGVKKIVQVFSDLGLYGLQFQDRLQSGRPHQERLPELLYMARLTSTIAWLLVQQPQVEEFVIVNGRQLHYKALELSKPTSHADREARFEAMIYDAFSRKAPLKVHYQPGLISIKCKTRNINIKFISLRKYLETHDWSGEFTEEEAEPWLNDDWIEIE